MAAGAELPVGSELLGYRIEGVLGRGGMGIVYLAEDLRLKRRVALKLLSPELGEDERLRERLLAESELAASLDHPNIVPIYTASEADGRVFIAMRYVEGEDLKRVLKRGPLTPEHSLALVSQVASALDAAHARGLVHRDVKPSNVLIAPAAGHDGGDHVYLADFGLTKRLAEQELSSRQGQLIGTVDYVAPEQIRSEVVDGAADVYSLGCLLFECLGGEPPFRHRSEVALLFAHLREEPPSLHALRPDLAQGIDSVVARALAKEPDERYQTCRELVEAAREALGIARPAPVLTRRRLLVAGGAGALGIAAAAAVPSLLLTGGGKGSAPILPLSRSSLVRLEPQTGEAVAAIALGPSPIGVAVGEHSVWAIESDEQTLSQIEPNQNRVVATKSLSHIAEPPTLIAAGEGAVWILFPFDGLRYDPATGSVMRAWNGNDPSSGPYYFPLDLAVGAGAVWVSNGSLLRLDPATGTIVASIPDVTVVAVGESRVWAANQEGRVARIDPSTNLVARTSVVTNSADDIAAGQGAVWVMNSDDDSVARVDPATVRVTATPVRVGRTPKAVAAGGGAVWVMSERDGTVTRIDPATFDVKTLDVGGTPQDLAVGAGGVWVAVRA